MQRWNVLLLVGLFCLAPMEVLASPIYVIENPDGSTTFTSRKPRTGRAKVFTAKDVGFSIYRSRTSMRGKLFQSRYRSIIGRVSSRHGIDSSLVRAIIHVESAFNPRARSPKGAMGLMQLMLSSLTRVLEIRMIPKKISVLGWLILRSC